MTPKEWNELKKSDFSKYFDKYLEFQFNPTNICKCSHCPDNDGINLIDVYPCGQKLCWVQCACHIGID